MASITPTIVYRDSRAAIEWLRNAFNFEVSLLLTDDDGNIAHVELSYGDAKIGVCQPWSHEMLGATRLVSPMSLGGQATAFNWIRLEEPLDAHCARAKAAGAEITQEPANQFYGDRTYRARDLDGHVWCFSEPAEEVSVEEMEKRSGLKVEAAEA
ncbi:MAG: VOC family protein [Caulobacteraceae bacterium]